MIRSALALLTLLLGTAACAPSSQNRTSAASSTSPRRPPTTAVTTASSAPPTAPPAVASVQLEETEYIDCSCGCCPGDPVDRCVDTAKGETIASIKAASILETAKMDCRLVGCSVGFRYRACAP